METGDMEAAIAKADALLEKEQPCGRQGTCMYSQVSKSAFESVSRARTDGFSFVQICDVFEKVGLLPGNSRSNSLRQAFYREAARRKRGKELLKRILDGAQAERKDAIALISQDDKKANAETEEERIKRLTSVLVNTGNGKIIKHADGSFDF